MGIFENWPYINFHEKNLDWLVKQEKHDADMIKDIQDQLADLDGTIQQDVINQLNEWLLDGTLTTILSGLVAGLSATVDLKLWRAPYFKAINFSPSVGDLVITGGYNSLGDHGAGLYVCTSLTALSQNGFYFRPLVGETALALGVEADGVTDNTSQLIQAMAWQKHIDFLQSDVVILSSHIPLSDNVSLDGHGCTFAAKLNSFTSGSSMIGMASGKNIRIQNINFDRQSASTDFFAISLTSCENILINGCSFVNGLGYMVRLSGSSNVRCLNCSCNNVNGISGNPGGLFYQQGGHDMVFDHIKSSAIQDHVIYIDGSPNEAYDFTIRNIIAKNHLTNNLTAAAVIAIYGDAHNFEIDGVDADTVITGISILSRNDIIPKHGVIQNCKFNNIDDDAIEVIGDANTATQATYITITSNELSNVGQDGISVRYCRCVNIQDNWIRSVTRYGIELSKTAFIKIAENYILNITATGVLIGNIAESVSTFVLENVFQVCDYAVRTSYTGSINNYISNNVYYTIANVSAYLANNKTNEIVWTTT